MQGVVDIGVQSRIDAVYNQVRSVAYSDPLKPFSNAEYDAGKDWLKDWYAKRYAYLRSQIATNNAAFVSQTVPAGMTLISSPTNLVWIEGSTQYDGPSSLATVNAIQRGTSSRH